MNQMDCKKGHHVNQKGPERGGQPGPSAKLSRGIAVLLRQPLQPTAMGRIHHWLAEIFELFPLKIKK